MYICPSNFTYRRGHGTARGARALYQLTRPCGNRVLIELIHTLQGAIMRASYLFESILSLSFAYLSSARARYQRIMFISIWGWLAGDLGAEFKGHPLLIESVVPFQSCQSYNHGQFCANSTPRTCHSGGWVPVACVFLSFLSEAVSCQRCLEKGWPAIAFHSHFSLGLTLGGTVVGDPVKVCKYS